MAALTINGTGFPVRIGGYSERPEPTAPDPASPAGQLNASTTPEMPMATVVNCDLGLLTGAEKTSFVTEMKTIQVTLAGDLPSASLDCIVRDFRYEAVAGTDPVLWTASFEALEATP